MALTPRKKRGIGFFITGGIFILFGGIVMKTVADPSWLTFIPLFVGLIAEYFGFKVVFPDIED